MKPHKYEFSVGVDCGGDKKTAPCGNTRRLSGHLDRRLDKADAASVLVVLLVFPLLKAFDALDATDLLVRTEFLAIGSPPFVKPTNERRQSGNPCRSIVAYVSAAVNEISHIRRERNLTLREMRDRANLSCALVGKKLFVDQSCVRHWEYGDWAPARKYYAKMAKLYGVSEEEIKAAADAIRAANRRKR